MEGLHENENLHENEIDDSYILKEDKLALIRCIKKIYENTMSWADDILMRVIVKQHYNNVIKNMNKEDYLKEIQDTNINNLLSYID